jgi:hypothetical protein
MNASDTHKKRGCRGRGVKFENVVDKNAINTNKGTPLKKKFNSKPHHPKFSKTYKD